MNIQTRKTLNTFLIQKRSPLSQSPAVVFAGTSDTGQRFLIHIFTPDGRPQMELI